MKTYKEIINDHWSKDFQEFAEKLTFKEFHKTCKRGDWMLWLFNKSNPDCLKELTLAKGHCANTVRHLMEDERSVAAVDAAIAFGEGKITREELDKAADAAYYAAYADAAYYAAYYAAYAGGAADACAAAAEAAKAKKANQLETANICRKYLPIKIWNLNEQKQTKEPEAGRAGLCKGFGLSSLMYQDDEKAPEDIVEITQIRLHGKLYNLTEVNDD
jgi:hypothetical protein